MKAKEMAQRFNADPTNETLACLLHESIVETRNLADIRHIRTDQAMATILREADTRWRAFARLCPAVSPDAFKLTLHKLVPVSVQLFP